MSRYVAVEKSKFTGSMVTKDGYAFPDTVETLSLTDILKKEVPTINFKIREILWEWIYGEKDMEDFEIADKIIELLTKEGEK